MTVRVSIPQARFAARQWLRAGVGVLVLSLGGLGAPDDRRRFLAYAGLFALVYALPQAMSRIVEMDRDGRLDHVRLTGLSPAMMLSRLLLGSAGPWMVCGLIAFLLWPGTRNLDATAGLTIAAICGGSVALSLLPMALPRGWTGADARLVGLGLVVVALAGAALLVYALTPATAGETIFVAGLTRLQLAGLLLTAEGAAIALCLPITLRRVARPPAQSDRGLVRTLPLLARDWNPMMSRVLTLCTPPAVMVALITAGILVVARAFGPDSAVSPPANWIAVMLTAITPLIVGVCVISLGARADRTSGRFDILRLTPARPIATLVSIALGVCLPFIAATIVAHGVVLALWGEPPAGLRTAILSMLFVAPVAAVEGWRGAWPWTYCLPVSFVFFTAMSETTLWPPRSFELSSAALLLWVPWLAAARFFRRPLSAPLTGWAGVAFAACLAAAAVSLRGPQRPADLSLLIAALLATTGLMVDAIRSRRIDAYGPGMAAAAVTAAVVLGYGYRTIDAAVLAAVAAGAWWIGRRIHEAGRAAETWSTTVRMFLAIVFLLRVPDSLIIPLVQSYPASRTEFTFAEYVTRSHAVLAALVAAIVILAEAGYRLATRRLNRQ